MEDDSVRGQDTRLSGAINTPIVMRGGLEDNYPQSLHQELQVAGPSSPDVAQQPAPMTGKYNFPGKKTRTQFTPKQLLHLEEKFSENQFPNASEREEIAEDLELTVQHIQVWFQNRRAKNRRKSRRKERLEKLTVIEPPDFWPRNLSFDSNLSKGLVVSPDQSSNSLSRKKSTCAQSISTSEEITPSPSTPSSQTATGKTSASSPLSTCSTGTISLQESHSDVFATRGILSGISEQTALESIVAISSPSILAESPVRLYDILKDMPDLTPSLLDDPLVISTQSPILPQPSPHNIPGASLTSHHDLQYGAHQSTSIHMSPSYRPLEPHSSLMSTSDLLPIHTYHLPSYTPSQGYLQTVEYPYPYAPQYPEQPSHLPPPPPVAQYTLYDPYPTHPLPFSSQPTNESQEDNPSISKSSHYGSHHCY